MEALKRRQDLVILGCGELIQSLLSDGLVDQYILLIHPLVLGSGRRLFPNNGTVAKLQLTDSVTTSTGVVIATTTPQRASGSERRSARALAQRAVVLDRGSAAGLRSLAR